MRQLARDLLEAQGHHVLKVLYTSGFTGHAVAGHGLLDEGGSFIPKPFSGAALLRQVSAALVGG